MNKEKDYYGVKIKNKKNYTENALYINGEEFAFNGGIGVGNPDLENLSEIFMNEQEKIEIIIHASGFYRPFSLDEYNLVIGKQKALKSQEIISNAFELGGAALCIIIAIYYLSLYYSGVKDKGILFSILQLLSIAVYFLFSGERFIYQLIPSLPFEYFMKMRNLSTLALPFSIAGFTYATRKEKFFDKEFKVVRIGFILSSVFIILAPYNKSLYLLQFVFAPIILIYISIIFVIMKGLFEEKLAGLYQYNSIIYLIGIICVFTNYMSTILYDWGRIYNKTIGTLAIIIFIIANQMFLAIRFTTTHNALLEVEKEKERFFLKTSYALNAPLNSALTMANSIRQDLNKTKHIEEQTIDNTNINIEIIEDLITLCNTAMDLTLIKNNQLKLPSNDGEENWAGKPIGVSGYRQKGYEQERSDDQKRKVSKRDSKELKETILIVDDEIFNIQALATFLASEGYNIIEAYSGSEALKMAKENEIDLIILDMMMPGVSGIDICEEIREGYSIIELPILLSTSVNTNEDLGLGLQAGANDFITKPFVEREVTSRAKTLISLKRSMEEATKNEMAFLHAQIKPHFVYNTINAIIYFCHTDGEKAASLLTSFGQYLRLVFEVDNININTTVEKEIDLIKAFIEIQKARFGDKFDVEFNIDPEVYNLEIPTLIIEPLVENSIKYGLESNKEKCKIYVTAKINNNDLIIQVEDDGEGISKEILEQINQVDYNMKGIGLRNIKKRLSKMKDADMAIISKETEGTTINIRIGI